jgi:hypothetical protein
MKSLAHKLADPALRHQWLGDYFNDKVTDWVNARRIINGTDKAAVIASYAKDDLRGHAEGGLITPTGPVTPVLFLPVGTRLGERPLL